jgi:uncharacterized protein YjbJ (UPF0337 family)
MEDDMGELTDKTKGKVKETTGVVKGDRELETEGKKDRAKGEVKEGFENVKEKIRDTVHPDRNRQ